MKKIIIFAAILLFAAGCGRENANPISDRDISYRAASLTSTPPVEPKAAYSSKPPGAAPILPRAYNGAPPQIPHSIAGMPEITPGNNVCFNCHNRKSAKLFGATPIPESHYTDNRTGEKLPVLYKGRFNCVMCHVVQSDAKPLVGNSFSR